MSCSLGRFCVEPLNELVLGSEFLLVSLSGLSVLFEGCSVLVFAFPGSLPHFSLGVALFHLGIKLLLKPNFAPQALLVLLVLGSGKPKEHGDAVDAVDAVEEPLCGAGDRWRGIFATLFTACFVIATVCRVEAYPFSAIGMYSLRRDRVGVQRDGELAFKSEAGLVSLSKLCASRVPLCYSMFFANIAYSSRIQRDLPFFLEASLWECHTPTPRSGSSNPTNQSSLKDPTLDPTCREVVANRGWKNVTLPQCPSGMEDRRLFRWSLSTSLEEIVHGAVPRMEEEVIYGITRHVADGGRLLYERNESTAAQGTHECTASSSDAASSHYAMRVLTETAGVFLARNLCRFCTTHAPEDETLDETKDETHERRVRLVLGGRVMRKGRFRAAEHTFLCRGLRPP